MKRSILFVGVAFAALVACKSKSADAGTHEELAVDTQAAAVLVGSALTGSALTGSALTGSESEAGTMLGKTYECGAKGQKPCPMQGWMKSVLAKAAGSGEAKELANALDVVASKPVAGFDQWVAIAKEGADKARAGDLDTVKASCKKCHSLYQKKYREEMRDQAW